MGVESSYNVELLFAASFDRDIGSGGLNEVVEAPEGENRLSVLLEVVTRPRRPRVSCGLDLSGMLSESSLAWGRQEGKEDQGKILVQVYFRGYGSICKQWGGYALFWSIIDTSSVVSLPNSNIGIRVSVLLEGYRYPFEVRVGIDTWGWVSIPLCRLTWYRYLGCVSVPKSLHGTGVSVLASEYRYWLPENSLWSPSKHDTLRFDP
ncbi:hypothetical protein GQ457_13G016620 [Hibiscus cannabinus]